jgi:hypothetical protein
LLEDTIRNIRNLLTRAEVLIGVCEADLTRPYIQDLARDMAADVKRATALARAGLDGTPENAEEAETENKVAA